MAIINLRDYYHFYQNDVYIEVSEELANVLRQCEDAEKAYARKKRWHHAHYSLDFSEGMERHILFVSDSPHEHYEKKVHRTQLHAALSALPEKQAKRIYAHYFLGLSKAEIARSEGVTEGAVKDALYRGLRSLEKFLKKNF
ncbi:MAG: sigma-70 family RNA polymerase sigma factor [Clostridiales bacterium]|nr:sigma-70 family RNA polymerase sigma factor [Clostridiales bacterium]